VQPVPQPPLGEVVAGGQVVVVPPQYGGCGAPPEMQSVRVVSPLASPQKPGASHAHELSQFEVCTVQVFELTFHNHVHEPAHGAGVVVVDVVEAAQHVRRCSLAVA
jgi:hypothetical protein